MNERKLEQTQNGPFRSQSLLYLPGAMVRLPLVVLFAHFARPIALIFAPLAHSTQISWTKLP